VKESPFKRLASTFRQRTTQDVRSLLGSWPEEFVSRSAVRRRAKLGHVTFIGVTGSCGKSTTVKLCSAILSTTERCQCGFGSDPDQIAEAFRIDPAAKFHVHELQAHKPGRIAVGVRLLRPNIGIVTTIGGDHYKHYRSLQTVASEKGQLVESLPPDGVAILNADDPHVCGMAERTKARIITYGLHPEANLRAVDVSCSWPDRLAFTASYGHDNARVETRLVGTYWATSALAAIACGLACGIDLQTCANSMRRAEPVFGRNSAHVAKDGTAYILDTHKAPLWTIAPGLILVKSARAPRKTVVFGTISDYAGKGGRVHRNAARNALAAADRVVLIGPQAAHVDKLRQGEMRDRIFTFQTTYQASAFLAEQRVPGELIYVKGSSTDHLERIMLAELDHVVCWRERCGKIIPCLECGRYRIPSPPPFGFDVQEQPPREDDVGMAPNATAGSDSRAPAE
jgi:UDP-N-acetylmuramoyl-tripeptide--D-alanyl-D-alanine ligase